MSNLKKIEGGVTTPQGFTAGAVYTAIKKRENKKPDVAVLYSDLPCSCAACFTTNKFCAAPVILDREILKKGKARAVVINSGNANAATGKQGIEDARTVEREAEKLLGLGEDEVFVCSTGVIGQRLPVDKVLQGIREIIPAKLAKENGSEAAYAIMTTDTVRKECAYELQLSTGTVKIGGTSTNNIDVWNFADETEDDQKNKGLQEATSNVYGNGHTSLFADMMDAIEHDRKPYVDAVAGRNALEMILAIYQSAATGKPVKLPLSHVASTDFTGRFGK